MKAVIIEGEKTNTVQLHGIRETLEFEVSKRFLVLSLCFNIKKTLVFMLKQNLLYNDTKFEGFTKISRNGVVENKIEF